MDDDLFTFIVGGKAGQGVKKTGAVASQLFIDLGRQVFQMDDYMSLIRGGHNFSVVSTSTSWVSSHYMNADLISVFDKRSYDNHIGKLAEGGIMVYNSDEKGDMEGIGVPFTSEAKKYPMKDLMFGVGAIGILSSVLGFERNEMAKIIESSYPRGIEDNIEFANLFCDRVNPQISGKFKINDRIMFPFSPLAE